MRLAEHGIESPARSAGTTPTSHQLGEAGPITEIRPGNYVYYDATQVTLGIAEIENCALTVLATVVSRPDPRRLILDCGSKALAADHMSARSRGFGLVQGHPELVVDRLFEEHAIHLGFGVGGGNFLIEGTWNTDRVPELAPQPGDVVVSKQRYSGFFHTELDDVLREREIKSLVFVGWTTSVCVESTFHDAFFRDYRCVVLSDCTAEVVGSDLARTNHEASLLVIEGLFGWVADSESLVQALTQASLETAAR